MTENEYLKYKNKKYLCEINDRFGNTSKGYGTVCGYKGDYLIVGFNSDYEGCILDFSEFVHLDPNNFKSYRFIHSPKITRMKNYEDIINGLSLKGVSLYSVDEEKDYDILTLYGGLNGKGDFLSYMSQVTTIVWTLENEDLVKVKDIWLIDWINDCPDDVWTLRIGIRNKKTYETD